MTSNRILVDSSHAYQANAAVSIARSRDLLRVYFRFAINKRLSQRPVSLGPSGSIIICGRIAENLLDCREHCREQMTPDDGIMLSLDAHNAVLLSNQLDSPA